MARNSMRSFIKGHIRSESSTSDSLDHDTDNAMRMGPYNGTQFVSPTLQQRPQFTSPQNKTIRTPKKLLTPIKNLFSSPSHSKHATGVLSSGDRLNSALTGLSKDRVNPPQRRDQKRTSELPLVGKEASFVNLGLVDGTLVQGTRQKESGMPVKTRNVYGSHNPKASLSTPTLKPSGYAANTCATFNSQEVLLPRIDPPVEGAGDTLAPPLSLGSPLDELDEKLVNNSSISISDSKHFETKLVSFQTESLKSEDNLQNQGTASGNDDTHDDDEEYSDSDASEFSFVKDNAGGRNTSVKYYKTNKTPQFNDKAFTQLNEFNENDLGYEVDEFSDYDYENNGMDDDDLNYDDELDADVQYNNIFGEEMNLDGYGSKELNNADSLYSNNCDEVSAISSNPFDKSEIEVETAFTDLKLPDLNIKNHRPFNHSYHLSIEGLDKNVISQESIPKHDVQDEDILENYMDSRRLSSAEGPVSSASRRTPDLQSSGNLELYDLNSPLINGLTIGNNLRHRFRRDNDLKEDENDTNTNKLFIFRQASSESIPGDFKPLNEGYQKGEDDRAILKQRVLKSFHSSISDNLDVKISSKLDEIESFSNRRATDSLTDRANITQQKDVGLGILLDLTSSQCTDSTDLTASNKEMVDSSNDKQNTRLSVVESEPASNESKDDDNTSDADNQASKEPRLSVLGMMNILANIEDAQTAGVSNNEEGIDNADNKRRKSIVDMMDNLAIIESQNEQESKPKRSSITNMMSTLAMLENTNNLDKDILGNAKGAHKSKKESKNPLQRIASQIQNEKHRYSWYDDDEQVNFKTVNNITKKQQEIPESILATPPEIEKLHFENAITSLDKDLIDEANQLPEDFNFEEQGYPKYQTSPINETFFRSNSYTKRPIKSVIDNNFLSNKIETVNKTITFYRSNSTGHFSEFNRSGSVSRGPSTRSMKSFTSLDSDIMEEDKTGDHNKNNIIESSNGPYTFRPNFPLHSKSSESHNLDTISEADSPAV